MSNEIKCTYATGQTLYAIIIRDSDGTIRRTDTGAFEAIVGANWLLYDHAMPESGITGIYMCSMPAAVAYSSYSCIPIVQAGANPATTDTKLTPVSISWNGTTQTTLATVIDETWDEVLTGVTHNVPSSAGRRLRQIANTLIYDGTVVSSTTNSVVLDAGASAQQNIYRGCVAVIMSGAGLGQPRTIVEYIGGVTRRAMLDRPWVVNPALGDEIILVAASQELVMAFGTVVSAGSNTLRLAATESVVSNIFRYSAIVVTSSTGADSEARLITSYDGPTQTVTVSPPWTVVPLAGDVYKIMPIGRAVMESASNDAITAAVLSDDAITEI